MSHLRTIRTLGLLGVAALLATAGNALATFSITFTSTGTTPGTATSNDNNIPASSAGASDLNPAVNSIQLGTGGRFSGAPLIVGNFQVWWRSSNVVGSLNTTDFGIRRVGGSIADSLTVVVRNDAFNFPLNLNETIFNSTTVDESAGVGSLTVTTTASGTPGTTTTPPVVFTGVGPQQITTANLSGRTNATFNFQQTYVFTGLAANVNAFGGQGFSTIQGIPTPAPATALLGLFAPALVALRRRKGA